MNTTTALLVIDVQQSFTQRPYFNPSGLSAYLQTQNHLIEQAQAHHVPIVRVFHVETGADNPFSLASGFVRPMDGLRDHAVAHTVHKTRHSALVGTGLDVWLVERGIRELVVSGIRTEQCCETTTRHASDLGWQVRFAMDATMTWDIALPKGGVVSAHDLRERTMAVLHNRFAQVVDADDAFNKA
jgi:nicotinamidase-related amidase